MPTPEDIIRKRMADQAAAEQHLEHQKRQELNQLWQQLTVAAAEAIERLKAKGYPDGKLVTIYREVSVTNWRGKVTSTRNEPSGQLAGWKIGSYLKWSSPDRDGYLPRLDIYILSNGSITPDLQKIINEIEAGDYAGHKLSRDKLISRLTSAIASLEEALKKADFYRWWT